MEMSGRPIAGFVFIDPPPRDERTLRGWLELGLAFVNTLPPKPPRSTPPADQERDGGEIGGRGLRAHEVRFAPASR